MQEAINTEIDSARLVGEEDSSGRLDLLRARWNDYVARAERDVVDQARAHERRREDPSVREALLALVEALRTSGDERKRRVQAYAASVERVGDPALRAALEVRLAGLER